MTQNIEDVFGMMWYITNNIEDNFGMMGMRRYMTQAI